MTRYFYILLGVVVFFAGLLDNACAWEAVVVKVIDGDSLKVQRNGNIHEIRLYGIDTPEYRQPYSNKAKQFTKRLAYRQIVNVVEKDIDRYDRIVALVMVQGKLINSELVREGLAWYYPRYCHSQPVCGELQLLERKARQEHRGLWRDKNPVSPWEWKRQKKSMGPRKGTRWYYRFLDWL